MRAGRRCPRKPWLNDLNLDAGATTLPTTNGKQVLFLREVQVRCTHGATGGLTSLELKPIQVLARNSMGIYPAPGTLCASAATASLACASSAS